MAGLSGGGRWTVLPRDERSERRLVDELGLPPLVARVLAARGVTDPRAAREFLSPSLERDWADPLCIPGMADAVARGGRALDDHETIAVFGDFDVDGMTSTCLLTLALRRMGADVHPFIPHRFGEGYGLSREALARVREACDPSLVVTVDNGIASAREVEWLVAEGIDVVVTDHHEPSDLVPSGVPVTDPKLSCDCPSRELAGVGVALKLVCELGGRRGMPDLWLEFLDVAALGTLSDMMQLTGENRAIVAEGIRLMRRSSRPGIAALAATAGIDLAQASADGLPFSLIPRLNAAGRMDSTDVALELLLTEDVSDATILAGRLEAINAERKETEGALAEEALAEAERTYRGGRAVVVGGRGWHEGVKGIVASRLVSRYHVPAIVFTIDDEGVARGSGRSVGSVDLFHAVEQCSDVLVRFGGHAGAVGVTCEASRLDEFRARLDEALDALPAEQFVDVGEVTAVCELGELTVESLDALELLQPFGQGNKKPILAARGVSMRNRALVGADGAHLRFTATDGVSSVAAIMFRVPEPERAAAWEGVCDLVFEAVNETWQGRTKPKLMVKDILYRDAPREGASAPEDAAGGERDEAPEPPALQRRAELSALDATALDDALRRLLIGDAALLPAQSAALDRLAAGRSCLAVMATGRGKSLVFHLHAAREAISRGRASVFVYPLRALVADQFFHLREDLARAGVTTEVLTGETSQAERARIFAALASGAADIVLTTPELSSSRSIAPTSRSPGASASSWSTRRTTRGSRPPGTVTPTSSFPRSSRTWVTPSRSPSRRPRPRTSPAGSATCSPSTRRTSSSMRRSATTFCSTTGARPATARRPSPASSPRARSAWSTSPRATARSVSCACCATGSRTSPARSPTITPGSPATPACASSERFARTNSRASSRRVPSARASTSPGSGTSCSLGCPSGRWSSTR